MATNSTLDLRTRVTERTEMPAQFSYSKSQRVIASILFLFFLLQPASLAFGAEQSSEVVSVPESVMVEEVDTEQDDVIADGVSEEVPLQEIAALEPVVAKEQPADGVEQDTEPASVVEDVTFDDILTPNAGSEENTSSDEDTTDTVADEVVSTTTEEEVEIDDTMLPPADDDVTDTPEDVPSSDDSTVEDDAATTTDNIATTTPNNVVVVESNFTNEHNRYQFAATECVAIGDGSFYCAKSAATTTENAPEREDGVFTAPDKDGDLEIYVSKNGELTQLTSNTYDDSAPFYDQTSERIVFHRLIDDRYQIVSLDLKREEETYLTNTPYNNMEPTAYGDITVWQSWMGNSWEVMMLDGENLVRLSENETHDIAPHINQDYIIWQTQIAEDWFVHVYNRTTGETEEIPNEEGVMVENPRFVLVYDARMGNGDIQTMGYDLETKEIVPLSATPTKIPANIPEPDQTGEERALIQNKPKIEEETPEVGDVPQSGAGSDTPPNAPQDEHGTTTSAVDERITPDTTVASSTQETLIPDLVIPPFAKEE